MDTVNTEASPAMGIEFAAEFQRYRLPFLVALFPVMVALFPSPLFLGVAFAVCLIFAHCLKCLKPFLIILGVSLLLNTLVYSGATTYSDTDAYLAPQIRLLAATHEVQSDGFLLTTHLHLPHGFAAWCVAWYRLTGSLDCGAMLVFMLIPAAWCALCHSLSRLQTVILLLAPAAFPSFFCMMPDGVVYYFLLMALFMLRDKEAFWVPLLMVMAAAICKTTAWIPCCFVALVLLYRCPRKWWQLGLLGGAVILYNLPTVLLILRGGLSEISSDFEASNDAAKAMGYLARLAYAYIGHWTTSASPVFAVPRYGLDGGGIDGFGPIFRLAFVAAIGIMVFCRKKLQGWWLILLLSWGSILLMPTLYIGYARYVPWLYPAVMLPLVLVLPRLSLLFSGCLCVLPMAWLGWRIALSTEYVTVSTHATAVSSHWYNVRCDFRDKITEARQPTLSGSLSYYYAMPEADFPPIPRKWDSNQKQRPGTDKIKDVRDYALHAWMPWMVRHAPQYLGDLLRLRWQRFWSPRGQNDELPAS